MFWLINIFYVIVLTSATGAIATVVWYLVGKLLERAGFLNIQYELMKIVMLFWGFPALGLVLWFANNERIQWHGKLFRYTTIILIVAVLLCFIWAVGVVVCLIRYRRQLRHVRHILDSLFECDNQTIEVFREVCACSGIPEDSVSLGQSYMESVPEIAGVIHPTVVLPVEKYTEEELYVIFRHELMHARHRDALLKNLLAILYAFHWFNPAMRWLRRLLGKWSEYACDYAVCLEEQGFKNYYKVIFRMAIGKAAEPLVSQVREDETSVLERYEHISRCYGRRTKSGLLAGLIIFGMAVTSLLGICLFTASSAAALVVLFQKTYSVTNESNVRRNMVIKRSDEMSANTRLLEFDSGTYDEKSRTGEFSDENIKAGSALYTGAFYVEAGEEIGVVVFIEQEEAWVRVGIIGPDGIRKYAEGTTMLLNVFESEKDGNYRIFVENISTMDISVFSDYYVHME